MTIFKYIKGFRPKNIKFIEYNSKTERENEREKRSSLPSKIQNKINWNDFI